MFETQAGVPSFRSQFGQAKRLPAMEHRLANNLQTGTVATPTNVHVRNYRLRVF
jgi:hypothetical protein